MAVWNASQFTVEKKSNPGSLDKQVSSLTGAPGIGKIHTGFHTKAICSQATNEYCYL